MIIKETSSELNSWNCITFLKCLAALLITNAHLGPFYPERFQFLSFGGALGNSLFFLCSGWALVGGVKKMSFPNWYIKRAIRVLIPVWSFMLITSCMFINSYNWCQFFQTPYWFLNAILLFYIPYYLIIRYAKVLILPICGLLSLGCIFEFMIVPHNNWMIEESVNDVYIHYWYYFIIMLVGAWIRLKVNSDNSNYEISSRRCAVWLLGGLFFFFVYMGNKFFIIHTSHPIYSFQLLLPICLVGFAVCLYFWGINLCRLGSLICNNIVINFIASITLEIYIVQFSVSHYLVFLPFPIGIISNIAVILSCAKLLNIISSRIVQLISKYTL